VVEKDERETGLRMILNFGHTVGHALESLTHYRAYHHGEAVAVGMVAATKLAHRLHLCDQEVPERVKDLLDKIGLPTELSKMPSTKIIDALIVDKKVRAGKVQFVLPEKLGKVVIKNNVPVWLMKQVLKELGAK